MNKEVEEAKEVLMLDLQLHDNNTDGKMLYTSGNAICTIINYIKELEEELNSVKEIYYTQKDIENDYISKQKILDIFDIKIHNFKVLAETDWYEDTKQIDYQIADILKIILQELLEEGE